MGWAISNFVLQCLISTLHFFQGLLPCPLQSTLATKASSRQRLVVRETCGSAGFTQWNDWGGFLTDAEPWSRGTCLCLRVWGVRARVVLSMQVPLSEQQPFDWSAQVVHVMTRQDASDTRADR